MSEEITANIEDAAWVTIETPFSATELRAFLDDVERLYRINPLLVFEEWTQSADQQFHLKANNLSNARQIDTLLSVSPDENGITVSYQDGLRSSTRFQVDTQSHGLATLVVTDDYSGIPLEEREARVDEVDNSLVNWGKHLHHYLQLWKRWSWLPGWQYYMRRVWQPMKPSARRITKILLIITVMEFVFFLMVFTIFYLELNK